MADGVLQDTVTEFKAHPWLIGGSIVGLVLLFYLLSGSKKTATPASLGNFTYSIGPTDAQLAAQTSQANQTAADQTAVSLANIQATANTTLGQSYFQYLATNSANNVANTASANAAAVNIAQIQGSTTLGVAGDQLAATQSSNAAGVTTAQIGSNTALGVAGYQTQATLGQASAATTIAATQAAAATTQAGYASSTTIAADSIAAGTQQAQISSTERQNAAIINSIYYGALQGANVGTLSELPA